jgi:hypothetical protein
MTHNLFDFYMEGRTIFYPVIKDSMGIAEQSGFQYHILLVVADGQVLKMPLVSFLA